MSFLSDLIEGVRKELSEHNPDFSEAVRKIKTGITNKFKELHDENNLLIFDGDNGGAIRGPKESRVKCENKETGAVLCQEKRLIKGNEVPYFRAVFNLQDHKFTVKTNPESIVRLIGYESPLMRKKPKKRGGNGGPKLIACDLIGLTSDNRVVCIEGKVKQKKGVTDIIYGLLESFAYGVCIEYFLSDKNRRALFINEVRSCVNEFHAADKSFDENKLAAAFALAAPKKYFSEYFKPSQTGSDRAHRNLKEDVVKLLCEAERLLAAFQGNGPTWAGFLIMNSPCIVSSFEKRNGRIAKGESFIEPHFKSDSLGVELAGDLKALEQRCKT